MFDGANGVGADKMGSFARNLQNFLNVTILNDGKNSVRILLIMQIFSPLLCEQLHFLFILYNDYFEIYLRRCNDVPFFLLSECFRTMDSMKNAVPIS